MTAAPYRTAAKRFGLIGHPVAHSVSPAMMRAAFDALGLPYSYEALDVSDAALDAALASLHAGNLAGLNVTIPHKRAALALADEVGESARAARAANVLVRVANGRVRAENTDAAAMACMLEPLVVARRWALILGSGGAACAAVVACEMLGFYGVEVTSRSWTTMEEAQERGAALPAIRAEVQLEPWVSEWGEPSQLGSRDTDLVIQATSAGMEGVGSGEAVTERVAWSALGPKTVAFDVVYRPRSTPFLAAAQRHGLVAEGGLGMLVWQAALALKMWLGVDAPRDVMLSAASSALGA